MMDRTLKALSLTLSYPNVDLQEAMPEIGAILGADPRIAPDTRAALQALTDGLGKDDLFDVQESYVMLFDRSRTLSLNLFEHVHGESRDRNCPTTCRCSWNSCRRVPSPKHRKPWRTRPISSTRLSPV